MLSGMERISCRNGGDQPCFDRCAEADIWGPLVWCIKNCAMADKQGPLSGAPKTVRRPAYAARSSYLRRCIGAARGLHYSALCIGLSRGLTRGLHLSGLMSDPFKIRARSAV